MSFLCFKKISVTYGDIVGLNVGLRDGLNVGSMVRYVGLKVGLKLGLKVLRFVIAEIRAND